MPPGKGEEVRPAFSARRIHTDAPVVLIDACIWHHSFSRNVLRHLALAGALHIRWSRSIESEWIHSVRRARPEIPISRLLEVRNRFRTEFPDGLAPELLPRVRIPRLPDRNDEHVLRAALATGASRICTLDRHGFPDQLLRPLGIRAVSPSELVANCLQERTTATAIALQKHRTSLMRPPFTAEGYVRALRDSSLILNDEIAFITMQALIQTILDR